MNLAEDLLAQAKLLASLEKGRPRQASLRRAISAAYYAVFHLLVMDGCRKVAPGNQRLQKKISRAFVHKNMQRVCSAIANDKPKEPSKVHEWLPPHPLSADLKTVARMFYQLQEARERQITIPDLYTLALPLKRMSVKPSSHSGRGKELGEARILRLS
jgi:hypothetical protein